MHRGSSGTVRAAHASRPTGLSNKPAPAPNCGCRTVCFASGNFGSLGLSLLERRYAIFSSFRARSWSIKLRHELLRNYSFGPFETSGFHYAADRIYHDIRLVLVDGMTGSTDDLPLAVVGQLRVPLLRVIQGFHSLSALTSREHNERPLAESG